MRSLALTAYGVFLVTLFMRNVVIGAPGGPLGAVSPTQLAMLGALTISVVTLMMRGNRRVSAPYLASALFWIALVVLYCFVDSLSAVIHDSQDDIVRHTLRARIATVLTFLLPFFVVRSEADETMAFRAVSVSAILMSMTAILTALDIYDFSALGGRTARYESSRVLDIALPRTSGILNDFGDIASLFCVATATLVIFILHRPDRKHSVTFGPMMASIFALGIIFFGAVVTLSRNVWVASLLSLAASAVVLVILYFNSRPLFVACLFAALLCSLIFAVMSGSGLVSAALQMREESNGARFAQYSMVVTVLLEHPFFGIGVEGCVLDGVPVHSLPLLAACRGGLLGASPLLVLYVAIAAVLIRDLLRSDAPPTQRLNSGISLAGYCGFAVASLLYPGGASNSDEITWSIFGLFAAIASRRMAPSPNRRQLQYS